MVLRVQKGNLHCDVNVALQWFCGTDVLLAG